MTPRLPPPPSPATTLGAPLFRSGLPAHVQPRDPAAPVPHTFALKDGLCPLGFMTRVKSSLVKE